CSCVITILVSFGFILRNEVTELSPFLNFLTDSILLEFIFGIFCFVLYKKTSLSYIHSLVLICLGSFLMFYQNEHGFLETSFGRTIHSGVPMVLVFLGTIGFESLLRNYNNNFISRLGVLLGDASYSIYLTHPFVLSPVAIIGKHFGLLTSPLLFSTVLLFSSCVVGIFVYLFIERPLHTYIKDRFRLNKTASV
ncbi:TPA: acyltransferase, partial [Klebsiella variicola subsp. variicola]|nr:acyltransferase [Klebsiella variicola subsp. variicola]